MPDIISRCLILAVVSVNLYPVSDALKYLEDLNELGCENGAKIQISELHGLKDQVNVHGTGAKAEKGLNCTIDLQVRKFS